MKGDDKKCLAAGCDDYISKPLDRARLIEVVGKYLQAKESAVCKGSSAEA
jgi:CheY-like chemotaxis protein